MKLDFAFNKTTGNLISAETASKWGRYICPVCKSEVNLRSGAIRKAYFAHWPGFGSPACEFFVPNSYSQNVQEHFYTSTEIQRIDLYLKIPPLDDRRGWYLELILPSCKPCQATLILDVGGRFQSIDMRGMEKRRHVTAELSISPYRITSYLGNPDTLFVQTVEKECSGLPTSGAAVFTASGVSNSNGLFPRAKELRCSEVFAFLWQYPINPDFPEELSIDPIKGRNGWNLALITLPETITQECSNWLYSFTKLSIAPSAPSILPIWPFLSKNSTINEVECIKSSVVLFSVENIPLRPNEQGPKILVQGQKKKASAVGMNTSSALFALKPGSVDFFEISSCAHPNINKFISFSFQKNTLPPLPMVELVFSKLDGALCVFSLHQKECIEYILKLRENKIRFEYLSLPRGAEGIIYSEASNSSNVLKVSSGMTVALHNKHMNLPSYDVLNTIRNILINPFLSVEIDFHGFGRLSVPASKEANENNINKLSDLLKSRLVSFMLQLQPTSPIPANKDLINAFANIQPKPHLIPHYRTLMNEVLASGFKLERQRKI